MEKNGVSIRRSTKSIECDALMAAQNRIYYAIFYSVMTLAYSFDYKTSKHSKLMGWFNKVFIHETKVFNKEMFQIYQEAFANRMDSDYSCNYEPNINEIKECLKKAQSFISNIKNYLIKINIL